MIGWLNLVSLVLGLIACILPFANLMQPTKPAHNWAALSMTSISACAISLFIQIFTSYIRVKTEDWSALMDIMGATVSVSAVLLVFTIVLNLTTLFVYRNRMGK
ncbi:hypothetical protein ACFFK0_27900 [Paenibacillus chartarius]|uniref:Cytochrome c oxidase subunit 4 n=1 Tax=Paenibacillus chartarius TaxID=747481 RepID=A0ABV6DU84_9BACL